MNTILIKLYHSKQRGGINFAYALRLKNFTKCVFYYVLCSI